MALHLRRHPAAGVRYAQHHLAAVLARLHLELAAVGHGVDRIRHQIGEQMAHETGIGANRAVFHFASDLDLGARFGPESEIEGLVDQGRELHGLGGRREAARLVEEAADDLRHPLHLGLEQIGLGLDRLGQIRPPRQELQMPAQ